jgi:hypothetical protein
MHQSCLFSILTCVFELRVNFVTERAAVDGSATTASAGRVTGLQHEITNHTMKYYS